MLINFIYSVLRAIKRSVYKIKITIKRLPKAIKCFLKYRKEFGAFANVQFREVIREETIGHSDYYIKKASEYMIKELQPIINDYKIGTKDTYLSNKQKEKKTPIWISWWQGYSDMPPLVKICYNRVLKIFNNNETQVFLITKNNYNEYITIPEYIIEKHNFGLIGNAHLADILRWGLMAKYGGAWIDATVFLTGESIEDYRNELTYPFFTQKFAKRTDCPNEPSRGLWSNFYFMGKHQPDVRIFDFVYKSLLYYWKKHDMAFDYVFLDYIIWAGYSSLDDIKALIDNVPANNTNLWSLFPKMNEPCTESEWQEILKKSRIYKLTYKANWEKYTSDNKLTYFGMLMSGLTGTQ